MPELVRRAKRAVRTMQGRDDDPLPGAMARLREARAGTDPSEVGVAAVAASRVAQRQADVREVRRSVGEAALARPDWRPAVCVPSGTVATSGATVLLVGPSDRLAAERSRLVQAGLDPVVLAYGPVDADGADPPHSLVPARVFSRFSPDVVLALAANRAIRLLRSGAARIVVTGLDDDASALGRWVGELAQVPVTTVADAVGR